ncbi:PQQ-dependent sugar dehydrogenase [Vibrio marisflavi]|uniref:Aldose sugar dehydrogenase YliI n=1 Tax=Vibrio marisflavi CECT 7928 TaxID=634439 RepID=A0ABN8E5R4_9VIBR|nr:PQQ-dependent sugar dehydrogenase [Vibrio marisflavi]CAH0540143.1 Aldose sugar dehydrogenase YliI [Vibrio marisflavi CECT 7928]
MYKCLLALLASLLPFTASADHYFVKKIASGFAVPWGITFVSPNKMLVTERNGDIRLLDIKTGKHKLAAEAPDDTFAGGQGGLMDIALSPFDTGQVYITYSKTTKQGAATTLAIASLDKDKLRNWQDLLITESHSDSGRHFGSRIAFSSQHIFMTVGDRGERSNGQNTQNHSGAILRLTPAGVAAKNNPSSSRPELSDEIWSFGHRNPQGIFFDLPSNNLWAIEHGPRGGDEINLIKAGANYGWPIVSYGQEYWGPINVGTSKEMEGVESPVKIYVPSIAPSSIVLYRGNKYPELKNKLLAGSLKLQHINVVSLNSANKANHENRLLENFGERIRDIEIAADESIYFSTDNGNIYQLQRD